MKLVITLGHNSSAVLINDDRVICGYEEERLSGVKSDSSYPVLSITKILEYYPQARYEVDTISISHWFWDWDLKENKYYRPKHLKVNFPNANIETVSEDNTHHDLHAKSVWNFCDGDKSGLTIVADGFGNFGECLSIYVNGRLNHRSYAVESSLGLMYQYAIGYLGMKENQDEYKLLGYEQSVDTVFKGYIEDFVNTAVYNVFTNLMGPSKRKHHMDIELKEARALWYSVFMTVDNGKLNRAKIAYFVQAVLERVMSKILKQYSIKNIKVSGGVFYNVKLNNMILRYSEKFEANPLAGDQGCGIGFTDVRYEDLFWGRRELDRQILPKRIDTYIEIFRGWMEFGPRALGNTSTLALPTLDNVELINRENGRDTIMPMAPVVTLSYAYENFKDIYKVGKSKHFMIIAYDFLEMRDEVRGAAHYDSDRDVYTGRLQIAPEGPIYELVQDHGGILINTSLNAHGQPILYDKSSYNIMKNIQYCVQDKI